MIRVFVLACIRDSKGDGTIQLALTILHDPRHPKSGELW